MPLLLQDSMPLSFKLLERSEAADGRVHVRGRFQHCDLKNRNGRIYPRSVWERHLRSDADFMKSIRDGRVFGHLEHPDDGRSNLNLAAIKIEGLEIKPNGEIIGELSTLSTQAGKTAAALFNDGLKIGISSRGHGSVQKNGEGIDEVQEDFVPEAFDLVAEPSTPGADLVKEALDKYVKAEALTEGKIPEDVQRRVRRENDLAMLTSRLETMERLVKAKATTSEMVHEASDLLFDLHRKFKKTLRADEFVNLEERIVSVKEFSRASMPEDDDMSVGSGMFQGEEDDDLDMGYDEPEDEEGCATPGQRIRSGGRGRGMARGGGRGPMGRPYGEQDDEPDNGDDDEEMPGEEECGPMYPEMRGRVRSRGEQDDDGWTDEEEDDFDYGMDADEYESVVRRRWRRYVKERRRMARRIALREVADTAAADELVLFIENDGQLYRQQHQPIQKNLITKWAKGVYDSRLAVKLFGYLVDNGAKKYAKEIGDGQPWNQMFDRDTRIRAAELLRDSFEVSAKEGEFADYLPKKYAGFVPEGRRRRRVRERVRYSSNDVETYFGAEDPAQLLDGRPVKVIAKEYCDQFPRMFGEPATRRDREIVLSILQDAQDAMGERRVREQATADLSHEIEVSIDLSDLTPEQREKFDVFRTGEPLETMATVIKAALPETLGIEDCHGEWEGDKIVIEIEFTGNPKQVASAVSDVMGQRVKLESKMRPTGAAPAGFHPDAAGLIQGLRDRCRALMSENAKMETENRRLRELGDAMAEVHRRERLQRRQEEIIRDYPALQAALVELNKARTVEELEEKAGVFLGIQGVTVNFRRPVKDSGNGKKPKKTESAPSQGSTRVQEGVPRPGELGGGTTVTDGNARTKGPVEESETTFSRLGRHYRTR